MCTKICYREIIGENEHFSRMNCFIKDQSAKLVQTDSMNERALSDVNFR